MQVRHFPFDLQGSLRPGLPAPCLLHSHCSSDKLPAAGRQPAHTCLGHAVAAADLPGTRACIPHAALAELLDSGPSTLVGLAKGDNKGSYDPAALIQRLVPAYTQLLEQLKALGVPEVRSRLLFLVCASLCLLAWPSAMTRAPTTLQPSSSAWCLPTCSCWSSSRPYASLRCGYLLCMSSASIYLSAQPRATRARTIEQASSSAWCLPTCSCWSSSRPWACPRQALLSPQFAEHIASTLVLAKGDTKGWYDPEQLEALGVPEEAPSYT